MNDHTNILANRMRLATSAAQRKILMQQAEAVISMASDPVEAARERASKAVSLYDDADAAMEKAAKEYQQAKVAAENARADENRKLSQASYTRDGSRPITGAEVTKQANEANKRLKSFDDRVEKAEKAYQQARKNYDAAAAAKQKAQAEYVAANVQARSGKMQADVSMAMDGLSDEERQYRSAMAEKEKAQTAAIKIAQQYQRLAEDLVRQLDGDDVNSARRVVRKMQSGLPLIEKLIDAIPAV